MFNGSLTWWGKIKWYIMDCWLVKIWIIFLRRKYVENVLWMLIVGVRWCHIVNRRETWSCRLTNCIREGWLAKKHKSLDLSYISIMKISVKYLRNDEGMPGGNYTVIWTVVLTWCITEDWLAKKHESLDLNYIFIVTIFGKNVLGMMICTTWGAWGSFVLPWGRDLLGLICSTP